jgi:aminoglycoside N3'-acetyltransferase
MNLSDGVTAPFLSAGDLAGDLRRLGLRAGDAVMLHASLRAIGPVEGGADGVLDAIEAVLGGEGTLLMILGAVVDHEWVNQHPEAERAALLADVAPYDPLQAPVLPEVGTLAEVFRCRPTTVVDDNPSGRFAAWGARAEELFRDAPWDDYYGPDSPLDRLCRMGGRVLRLGASTDTTTVLHYAEYLADVPEKRRVRRHYRVKGSDGPETRSVECLDDENGIVDWSGEDYFALILKAYRETDRARTGKVGNAASELIAAQDIVDFGARWMGENLGSLSG